MDRPAGLEVIERQMRGGGDSPEDQQIRMVATQAMGQYVIQKEQQRATARLDAVRIAADMLRTNNDNRMSGDAEAITARQIIEYADELVQYINEGAGDAADSD